MDEGVPPDVSSAMSLRVRPVSVARRSSSRWSSSSRGTRWGCFM